MFMNDLPTPSGRHSVSLRPDSTPRGREPADIVQQRLAHPLRQALGFPAPRFDAAADPRLLLLQLGHWLPVSSHGLRGLSHPALPFRSRDAVIGCPSAPTGCAG